MILTHIELGEANEFISRLHRHHKPVRGHRFSIGAVDWLGFLCGVAVVGRPVARGICHTRVVEVTRLCTDGTENACSFLYGAAARAAKALGYQGIGTYILSSESGVSLKATGWKPKYHTRGGDWNAGTRRGRRTDQPMEAKIYWYKELANG